MRIAILCLGSHGDVRPCVAVGCALKNQGHSFQIESQKLSEKIEQEKGVDRLIDVFYDHCKHFSASIHKLHS
jgi:hypothetical protein